MKYFLNLTIALSVAMIVLLSASDAIAQRTASVSGLWSSTATWGGASVPTSTDAVTINNNIIVTVDVPAVCAGITIIGGNLPSSVILSGSNTLTVSGGITINNGTAASANKTINVGSGALTCSSVTMVTTSNNNRVSYILIGSGSATVTGNISMGANALRNYITFSGSGTLNLGGSISGGDILPSTGTVNYNGTTAQTVRMNSTYVYNNLNLNNLAGATLSAAISATRVIGDVRVQSGILNNNGFNIVGNVGKIFEVADGALLQLGGTTSAFPTVFTPVLGAGSTVEYLGSGNQTVKDIDAPGYGNLILSGGGIKTAAAVVLPNPAGLDIRGDVTLNTGITFNTRTYVHNIKGNWYNDGVSISGNSTINFNGSIQAIDGGALTQTFYKISLDNNTILSMNCGLITINNTTTINPGSKLIIPSGNQVTAVGNIINSTGNDGLIIESDEGGTGSLILPNTGVSATVQRYVDYANWATWDDGWHFLSSPVTSQAINLSSGFITFTGLTPPPGNDYDFYAWYEPELVNPWINFKNTTTPPTFSSINPGTNFVIGRGYIVAYQQANTKEFTGLLNASDVVKGSLSRTTGSPNPGFHLLGNPYPSALTWYSGWANSNVSGVCHVWDGNTNSYAPLSAGGIIPAMNGFMVEALVNNASVTIPKAARIHDNATPWYKSASTPNTIKLIAWEESGNRGKASIIKLDPNSTTGFDAELDGHFLSDKAPKFYSVAGDHNLSLNTLPELGNDVRIPFAFAKNAGTDFYIQLDTEKTIPDLEIYLTDTKTGVETNLSQDKIYAFSSADGDDINRFVLHFLSSTTTGIATGKIAGKMQAYVTGNNLFINQSEAQSGKVYLFSITGKMIGTYALENSTSQRIGLPQMSPGIYLVNVKTKSGTYNQKVVIR